MVMWHILNVHRIMFFENCQEFNETKRMKLIKRKAAVEGDPFSKWWYSNFIWTDNRSDMVWSGEKSLRNLLLESNCSRGDLKNMDEESVALWLSKKWQNNSEIHLHYRKKCRRSVKYKISTWNTKTYFYKCLIKCRRRTPNDNIVDENN